MSAVLKERGEAQEAVAMDARIRQLRLLTGADSGNGGPDAYYGEGPSLFEQICTDPRYYLFHEDRDLIAKNAAFIAENFRDARRLLIIGPGHYLKEEPLIGHLPHLEEIYLIDVSEKFCAATQKKLQDSLRTSDIKVSSLVCDFRDAARHIKRKDHTVALMTGGTISNVVDTQGQPFPINQLFLNFKDLHALVKGVGGALAISYSSNQEEDIVADAYAARSNQAFVLNCFGTMCERAGTSDITPKNVHTYFNGHTIVERDVGPHRILVARHNVVSRHPHPFSFDGHGNLRGTFEVQAGNNLCILNSPQVPEETMRPIAAQARFAHKIALSSKSGVTFHIFNPT